MSQVKDISPQSTQRNAELNIGDHVDYHCIIGRPATSTGHKIKFMDGDVAWITGKSGCVALDALSLSVDCTPRNSAPSAVKGSNL